MNSEMQVVERQQPNREREVLALLLGLSQRMSQGAPLEELLEQIARATCEIAAADATSVMLLDDARLALVCQASAGLPDDEARQISFHLGEGIAGWVAQHGEAVRVPDTAVDPRFVALPWQRTPLRSLCCVPMLARGGVIGVLTASAAQPGRFDAADEALLSYLAAAIAKDVENARLYRLAVTDPLTGVYNRQYLGERLPAELERHRRYGQPLSLVMIDVDLFKQVNDRFGHLAGDAVLRELAHRLRDATRDVDVLVRYGGEEFVLILPSTPRDGARPLTERLHEAIGGRPFELPQGGHTRVTISAGIAELWPQDADGASLLARADARLYQAKAAGRDRVYG